MKGSLANLFKDWAEYGISSLIEIARRLGIKNVAIHTGETIAQRDPDLEADKASRYYDQIAKSFGFTKQPLDVGDLKGTFWVRTASAKVAGKRNDAVTSMTVGVDVLDFPSPLLIRWEQYCRTTSPPPNMPKSCWLVSGRRAAGTPCDHHRQQASEIAADGLTSPPPLPAAVVRRGTRRLLYREGPYLPDARLCLLRGGARPTRQFTYRGLPEAYERLPMDHPPFYWCSSCASS